MILKLRYDGPLALSWDDTALEPAISVWEESKAGACMILGSAAGVEEVSSAALFDEAFEKASEMKADKVHASAI